MWNRWLFKQKYGKSKDHRPNPIVQMGLFMDADGIPLAFSIFPGNNSRMESAPMVVAVRVVKGRSGFERDGSFSTVKGDGWQMFDAGIATEAFCLAAYEKGLGTVILGLFDVAEATALLEIPETQELVALICIGYPAENPDAPKRKTVADLLTYKS